MLSLCHLRYLLGARGPEGTQSIGNLPHSPVVPASSAVAAVDNMQPAVAAAAGAAVSRRAAAGAVVWPVAAWKGLGAGLVVPVGELGPALAEVQLAEVVLSAVQCLQKARAGHCSVQRVLQLGRGKIIPEGQAVQRLQNLVEFQESSGTH